MENLREEKHEVERKKGEKETREDEIVLREKGWTHSEHNLF